MEQSKRMLDLVNFSFGVGSERAGFDKLLSELGGNLNASNYRVFAWKCLPLRTKSGYTGFHYAAHMKAPGLITALTDLADSHGQAATIRQTSENGWTPLHQAVMDDNMEGVIEIINVGGDINGVARLPVGEWTPLMLAVVLGRRSDFLECILSYSPDVWIRDNANFRQTVGHVAAMHNPEILPTLLDFDSELRFARDSRAKTLLHYNPVLTHPSVVYNLLDHGADPNVQDVNGHTPLHFCWSLIVHLRLKTPQGQSIAFHWNCRLSMLMETRDLLLIYGRANPDITNRLGVTPSQWGFGVSVAWNKFLGLNTNVGSGLYSWERAETSSRSAWLLER